MTDTETITGQGTNQRIARTLLLVSGCIFMMLAILYNEVLLGLFVRDLPMIPRAIPRIREVQVYFFLWALALFSFSECVQRISSLRNLFRHDSVLNIFLSILSTIVVIAILEFSLRPFAFLPGRGTTIFMKDDVLGWKLKPYAHDRWAKVSVTINGKGLRGPELAYARLPHRKRILYIGDSVTFGFGLEYEQSFPSRVGEILNRTLVDTVETINSGVDGYSPWQEHLYLTGEGLQYQPDLVVLSFVLNDVVERFSLKRFGGWQEGWQLENTRETRRTLLDELATRSNIMYFIRMLAAKMRFGSDIQQGARKMETLYVGHLAYSPDRPEVQEAWRTTLEDLGKIFGACKEHHIPVLLVVFPFAFQFDNAEALSTPQRIVCNFARENNVPFIDLLPLLETRMKADGTKPVDYFLDDLHPSALGSGVVADTLAGFILKNRFSSEH